MVKNLTDTSLESRNVTFVQGSNQINGTVFDTSAFLSIGGGTIEPDLTYYFEFDYIETMINIDSNFKANHDEKLKEININRSIISIYETASVKVTIFDGSNNTKVLLFIDPINEKKTAAYTIIKEEIIKLKDKINSGDFKFEIIDNNGNTVTANAVTDLNSDGWSSETYMYDTLYTFATDSNIKFKLENAHVSSYNKTVKDGDKVYVRDENGKYLGVPIVDGIIINDNIGFGVYPPPSGESSDRLLFEIHHFRKPNMDSRRTTVEPIPLDYGFKLEILPSTIKDLFDGLSSFVDSYEFTEDTSYTLVDNDNSSILYNEWTAKKPEGGASFFYNLEIGQKTLADFGVKSLDSVDDKKFLVDEVFLTYEDNKYYFNYDNDYSKSKFFFNGSKV